MIGNNRVLFGTAALVVVALAVGGGYYLGKRNEGAAYADTATTPQMAARATNRPDLLLAVDSPMGGIVSELTKAGSG